MVFLLNFSISLVVELFSWLLSRVLLYVILGEMLMYEGVNSIYASNA